MLEPPHHILSAYTISDTHGFLPENCSSTALSQPIFRPWELLMQDLPNLIQTGDIRSQIDHLPLIDTSCLKNDSDWRRAYSYLGFLTHAYLWAGETAAENLPSTISIPFLQVAEYLGLPPTATYAGLDLWNFEPKHQDADITNPADLHILQTFTGTKDEEWFYAVSVSVEKQGAGIISKMLQCINAVREEDTPRIIDCLNFMHSSLYDLGKILNRMHERCDPMVFFHQIRPFLAGSKGMEKAGLPRGVFYDEGDGLGQWRQYSGGSNAQSSLIQFFDIVLGVDHHATGGSHSKNTVQQPSVDADRLQRQRCYIEEMRNYMPAQHRQFLSHVAQTANIRAYALSDSTSPAVKQAYNAAVSNLAAFRDIHIQIVTRYIILPSRMQVPTVEGVTNKTAVRKNIASTSMGTLQNRTDPESSPSNKAVATQELSGTGGTLLMPFLKQSRDETRDARVSISHS